MSRTWKTAPYWVQKMRGQVGKDSWWNGYHGKCSYCTKSKLRHQKLMKNAKPGDTIFFDFPEMHDCKEVNNDQSNR